MWVSSLSAANGSLIEGALVWSCYRRCEVPIVRRVPPPCSSHDAPRYQPTLWQPQKTYRESWVVSRRRRATWCCRIFAVGLVSRLSIRVWTVTPVVDGANCLTAGITAGGFGVIVGQGITRTELRACLTDSARSASGVRRLSCHPDWR